MINNKIKNISNFIEIIEERKINFPSEQIFYRGQRNGFNKNWKLIPSFYREKEKHSDLPFYNNIDEEINQIYKFVEKNHDYFVNIIYEDLISIINILQHYGFPTRVLDVTSNPLVSLYFALENFKETDEPVVYLIIAKNCKASYFVNKELNSFYEKNIINSKIVMVNGSSISDRIKNQKGDFILFFEDFDITKSEAFEVEELSIDKDSINILKKELHLLGINKSSIYPSLEEETCKFIKELNILSKTDKALDLITDNFMNGINAVNKVVKEKSGEDKERKYLKKKGALNQIKINK